CPLSSRLSIQIVYWRRTFWGFPPVKNPASRHKQVSLTLASHKSTQNGFIFPAPRTPYKNSNLDKRTATLVFTLPPPTCIYSRTLPSSRKMSKTLLPTHYQIPHSNKKLHDRVWRTKKFRILSATLLIFLCSLWAVASFSGTHFNFDTLRPYRNNAAAMAAVSALGEGGEEGMQALEFVYGKGHHFGIYDMFVDEEEDYDYEWGFWDSGRGKAKSEDKNLDKASESVENKKESENDKDNDENDKDNDENDNETKETSIENEIQDIIDKHKIVIFSKTYCS